VPQAFVIAEIGWEGEKSHALPATRAGCRRRHHLPIAYITAGG